MGPFLEKLWSGLGVEEVDEIEAADVESDEEEVGDLKLSDEEDFEDEDNDEVEEEKEYDDDERDGEDDEEVVYVEDLSKENNAPTNQQQPVTKYVVLEYKDGCEKNLPTKAFYRGDI
jgi:nucleosome binding factor SPN SPT16 subunit